VVHSRDDEGIGMAHKIVSSKKPAQTMTGQHWLGKTKPKKVFRLTQNAFKKLLRKFKKIYLEFSTSETQKQLS